MGAYKVFLGLSGETLKQARPVSLCGQAVRKVTDLLAQRVGP